MNKISIFHICPDLATWGERGDTLFRSMNGNMQSLSWAKLEQPVIRLIHYMIENNITLDIEERSASELGINTGFERRR